MTLPILIASILATLKGCFEFFLESVNRDHVRGNRQHLPRVLHGIVDRPTFDRSNDYTLAKNALNRFEAIYGTILLVLVLVLGVLPLLYAAFSGLFGYGVWGQALGFCLVLVVLSLPNLPLDWYSQFRIEERFGFNKSTRRLWVIDRLKGLLVSLALGVPLLALVFWIAGQFPNTWWLLGFGVVFGFQVLMLVLYPIVIVPLFNKLKPLEDGDLKDRLLALAERAGFRAKTIQVIDGSKRSSHSNAYFTGFGRFRRIVLFDTLIEQLEPEQIEAVLAHEIGHYRKGHIPKMIAVSAVALLLGFGVLHLLAASGWFAPGFHFPVWVEGDPPLARLVPSFLLFTVLAGLVTFWITPLGNWRSRRFEFEADAFAREAMGSSRPLIGALRRIYRENLGNLIPHPLYSRFHYSHPTLIERERALRGSGRDAGEPEDGTASED